MRILVTGSAGFIGFHLCSRFLQDGYDVCGVDNFNSFCGPELKKARNELTAHVYADQYGLQCIGLRFFTVYGGWYRPDMALSLFAGAMLRGEPLAVFNGGNLERDVTYVGDVVEGIVRCMLSANLGNYEILNIGRSKPENLMNVIGLLADELSVEPKYQFLPMQAGDMQSTWADVSKIADKTGYAPQTSIEQGIPIFARWFREYYKL